MRISMARKGNPYDNAAAESFMKTLKYEEVYLWDYHSVEDVKQRIPYFLQEVYNQKRLHSALGYVTPEEFEQAELASVALNQGTGMSTPGEIVGYRANGEAVYSVIYDKKCLDRKTT
jgi:hypothetical protein